MIYDTLKNADQYASLNPYFQKAFDFVRNNDLKNLPVGEYEVDGKNVVALIQEYTTMVTPPWESHDNHIDLQYLISGVEKIGYRYLDGTKHSSEYDADHDFYLLEEVEDANYAVLKDDVIMLLFPQDAHLPRLAFDEPIPVKKCCIKILAV
ncbi:MAG: YhcH/YjgK/YiaL family protein [Lachnospiraceae bacterium]|nr:YhcH/YjgK/YiaL family protein [Lachnospiraceae bacterium]